MFSVLCSQITDLASPSPDKATAHDMQFEGPQLDLCADLPILQAALAFDDPGMLSMGPLASSRALQRKDLARLILQSTDERLLSRKQFNTALTVGALPTELLTRIFTVLRDLYVNSPSSTSTRDGDSSDVLRWTNVTHVCSRWREIALGDPSLWACDIGAWKNREWIDEMLERAGSAPLSIGYMPSPGAIPIDVGPRPLQVANYVHTKHPLATIITPHISRVASLALHGRDDIYDIFDTCTDQQMLLEDLALRLDAPHDDNLSMPGLIPRKLFARRVLPNLRRLNLRGFEPPWRWKLLSPTIQDLSVHYPNYGSEFYKKTMSLSLPPIEAIVKALKKLPLLERLNLHVILPDLETLETFGSFSGLKWDTDSDEESPSSSGDPERDLEMPLYLEKLRHLNLYSDVVDCAQFLRALRFPSSMSMKLCLQGGKDDEFATVCLLLADHVAEYASARSEPLWFVRADPTLASYHILAATPSKDRRDSHAHDNLEPCLTLETTGVGESKPIPPETMQKGFFDVICFPIAADIEELHLQYSIDAKSPRYWIEVFGRMRGVRRLRLEHRTSPHFTAALANEEVILFPNLESIQFERIHSLVKPKPRTDAESKADIRDREKKGWSRHTYTARTQDQPDQSEGLWFWEDLVDALRQRKERYGLRLKSVLLRECRTTDKIVSALGEVVEDVVVENYYHS